MSDNSPTVGELFKANVVTHDDLNALIDAVLAGRMNVQEELAEGYTLDVAAAVKANAFATAVLRDKTSSTGARRTAARTAILLAVGAGAEDVTDPEAEVWRHTFWPACDFVLDVRTRGGWRFDNQVRKAATLARSEACGTAPSGQSPAETNLHSRHDKTSAYGSGYHQRVRHRC
ncbi:hypothetical protein [Methylorubrum extorquens]